MDDTIALVVKISKSQYEICKQALKDFGDRPITEREFAIAVGTPLDRVKAEIEKLNPVDYGSMFSYESHNGARDMQRDILEILDNIGKAESENKSCSTCKNSDDEFSGECYECVKNIQNHYETESEGKE